jgi:protein SCO1/2
MNRILLAATIALTLGLVPGVVAVARAQAPSQFIQPEIAPGTVPDEIPGVGVDERFDTRLPMDASFVDHTGRAVRLGEIFDGDHPVVLTFVYHSCASFCDMALRAVAESLVQQPWTVGVEYEVVTLSIDPRDAVPATLSDARQRILGRYGRAEAEQGWHFLGGTREEIARVADAVGYRFVWDERTEQFAHPGAILIMQPDGHVARYLYGLDYPHNDVRLALIDADAGRHSSSVEQFILSCYRWDHADGRYVVYARRLMRLGGLATMAILGGFLLMFWRRERAKDRASASARSATVPETSPASSDPSGGEPHRARES